MILLTSTSDLLRVTTSSAAAVKVHASHVDRSGATITPGRLNTAIASATTTTIVASPAASTDRTVKFVSIYNDDSSLSVTVTILHTDGTTAVDMWSATLAPQQGLQYDEGAGWSSLETTIYASAAQGVKADTAVQPGANATVLGSGAATNTFVLTANGSGGTAWSAASGGGTPGGATTQVQFNDGGAFNGDSGFTFDKTNKTLNVTGATITASDPIVDMAQTWNNAAVTFTGIKANVTDTASAAGSLLMDLQVGGVSRATISKSGGMAISTGAFQSGGLSFIGSTANMYSRSTGLFDFAQANTLAVEINYPNVGLSSDYGLAWASTSGATGASGAKDLFILRDAANTLAQRNGVNAQAFNLYQSYTDASNYTRGRVAAASGIVTIAGESAGTGATDIDIALTPKGTGRVRYGTHAAIAAETVTGYIEIKDAGGTVRKIAVVS